jgi:hypothetical protein
MVIHDRPVGAFQQIGVRLFSQDRDRVTVVVEQGIPLVIIEAELVSHLPGGSILQAHQCPPV